MNRKTTVLLVLGLLIVAGAIAWAVLGRRAEALPVRLTKVERLDQLISCVSANGDIRILPREKAAAGSSGVVAEMRIGETDLPRLKEGQPARLWVNALANATSITGHVSKIGLMALPAGAQDTRDFLVVLAVDNPPPALIVGMSCAADIAIATRENVLAIPIAALSPRSCDVDAKGNYAPPPRPAKLRAAASTPPTGKRQGKAGQKEFQGVFVKGSDGMAHFRVVKTGLMGDMDVEVLDGLSEGEDVITGPLASLRQIEEWTAVRLETEADHAAASKKTEKSKQAPLNE